VAPIGRDKKIVIIESVGAERGSAQVAHAWGQSLGIRPYQPRIPQHFHSRRGITFPSTTPLMTLSRSTSRMLIVIISGLAPRNLREKMEAQHGTPSQRTATSVFSSDATLQFGAYTTDGISFM
jgi:hypothetical protein